MAGASAASSRETVSPSGRLRARRAPGVCQARSTGPHISHECLMERAIADTVRRLRGEAPPW